MKLRQILVDNGIYETMAATSEYFEVLKDLVNSIPKEDITGYEIVSSAGNNCKLKLCYNDGEVDEIVVTAFNNEIKIRSDMNKKTLVILKDDSNTILTTTIYKTTDNYVEKIEMLNIDEIPAIGMSIETINNTSHVEGMPSLKGMGLYRYNSDYRVNLHVTHIDLASGNEFKKMEMYGNKVIEVINDFDSYNEKRFEEHNKNLKK